MTIHFKCKMPIKSAITVGEKSVECYLTGVKTVTVKMAGVDLVVATAVMATMTAASGAAAGGVVLVVVTAAVMVVFAGAAKAVVIMIANKTSPIL